MSTNRTTAPIALIPGPRSEFTELARTQKGRLFKKELLRKGTYPHPADAEQKLVIDDAMYDKLITNFNAEVCDIVQVPVADDSNRHVEDPLRNIGEVTKLEADGDRLYAFIDARDEAAADKLGKTLLGTSAMMHLNYTDTRTGEKVGPTLLHALVTNRPFITGMDTYEEIVAASADTSGDEPVVFATREEDVQMSDKEKLIAALREEHGVDVVAMSAQLEELEKKTTEPPVQPGTDEFGRQVLEVVKAAGVQLPTEPDEEDVTTRDVAEAVIELANDLRDAQVALTEVNNERAAERAKATESEVDSLVKSGHILPTQRAAMVKLARDDRETFTALVPEKPIVALSELGADEPTVPDAEKLGEEIARLSEMAQK